MTPALATALLVLPTVAMAKQVQRKCTFEQGITSQGTFDVRLPVTIAIEGARGAVAVSGSGTYQAVIRNKARDIRFDTPVSSEVITIGSGGEALWQIEFHDGRKDGVVTGYAGRCKEAR